MLIGHSRCRMQPVLTAAAFALLTPMTSVARADLLIGAVGPLTGPNSYMGEQIQQGVEAAVADLNAS